jgi:hypothetical protein
MRVLAFPAAGLLPATAFAGPATSVLTGHPGAGPAAIANHGTCG